MAVRADGRPARTRYRVLARDAMPDATLLELRLETGRTHQIRVHLAALGHPIVNDTRYGHRRDERLSEGRLFLHSSRIAFAHPGSSERIEVVSALPVDLAAISPIA
jgi:23S rRNA pseudouridine1911/1915/1917 synthase